MPIRRNPTVVGTNDTTGTNPFDDYEGTTFATEWTFKSDAIGGRPGGLTLGATYQEFSDEGLIGAIGLDDEVGGELFYNLQLTPATNLTFDLQVVDSALPNADTAVVGGLRVGVRF